MIMIKACVFAIILGFALRSIGEPFCSFLIGGLKPIPSQITVDYVALILLAISTFLPTLSAKFSVLSISLAFIIIATGSHTNRWTLTFPIVVAQTLTLLQLLPLFPSTKRFLGKYSTMLCLLVSAVLCILFPATEIPAPTGKYHVGLVDFHLPVNLADAYTGINATCSDTTDGFVSVRLLYPTMETPGRIPYVNPDIALDYLKVSMLFGAPPPLNKLSWMLHNWRLARIWVKPYAQPLDGDALHLIVHSHGLLGHSTVYSSSGLMLASEGYVVLQINHSDGSATVVEQDHSETLLSFDAEVFKLWTAGEEIAYVKRRREQTNHRVVELLASLVALQNLNTKDISALKGVSFIGKLKTTKVHVMGHSFGGATALTAALRRPELVTSVIAHEPAVDWIPDDARRALFPKIIMDDCPIPYDGGTGGLANDIQTTPATIQDISVIFLFSSEWHSKNWGRCDIIEWMHAHGKFCQQCTTAFQMIWNAHHNEFSDSCIMTPVWLGRAVGLTGKRNPIETSQEISQRTLSFLEQVRLRK